MLMPSRERAYKKNRKQIKKGISCQWGAVDVDKAKGKLKEAQTRGRSRQKAKRRSFFFCSA
jgi:hypothetical protein